MGTVIGLAQRRRQRERQAYRMDELPVGMIEMIGTAEMSMQHDDLDRLLDDAPELKP